MTVFLARAVRLASLLAALSFAAPAFAQQPSASAIANAKEIITIKGAVRMFEPILNGVIEQARLTFLQLNPMIGKDLSEVAADLRKEYAPRQNDIIDEVARLYATSFTEQELKDAVTFYKSPLGKKLVEEEPKILDRAVSFGQNWANKLSDEIVVKMRAAMKKKGHDI